MKRLIVAIVLLLSGAVHAGEIPLTPLGADLMVSNSAARTPYDSGGTGQNQREYYVIDFVDAANTCIVWHSEMPINYAGQNITPYFDAMARSAASGDVYLTQSLACIDDGEDWNTVTFPAAGNKVYTFSTQYQNEQNTMNTHAAGSCLAGDALLFRICRDGAQGTDTLASTLSLIKARLTF